MAYKQRHGGWRIQSDSSTYPEPYRILDPAALQGLKDLDPAGLHKLKHPFAIYHQSMSKVFQAFRRVLDAVDGFVSFEHFQQPKPGEETRPAYDMAEILNAQEELLLALQAHIDDAYQILKALVPRTLPAKPTFTDKLLEKEKHPTVTQFKNNITPYRDSFASIPNKAKHQTGRLCIFSILRPRTIPGYYLGVPDNAGKIVPDPEVYPNNSARSFYRDLRYHFCHVYLVGHHLATAVRGAIQADYGVAVKPSNHAGDGLPRYYVDRINKLPLIFFPAEVTQATPLVRFYDSPSPSVVCEMEVAHKAGSSGEGASRWIDQGMGAFTFIQSDGMPQQSMTFPTP